MDVVSPLISCWIVCSFLRSISPLVAGMLAAYGWPLFWPRTAVQAAAGRIARASACWECVKQESTVAKGLAAGRISRSSQQPGGAFPPPFSPPPRAIAHGWPAGQRHQAPRRELSYLVVGLQRCPEFVSALRPPFVIVRCLDMPAPCPRCPARGSWPPASGSRRGPAVGWPGVLVRSPPGPGDRLNG